MDIAKIFENGRSQAVRLPKEYRFQDSEVYIKKIDDIVLLIPKKVNGECLNPVSTISAKTSYRRENNPAPITGKISDEVYAGYQHLHLYY